MVLSYLIATVQKINFSVFRSHLTSPSFGIHGNQIIDQEMRNENKNGYNAMRPDSKISCYGTTGKVICNANQLDKSQLISKFIFVVFNSLKKQAKTIRLEVP